MHMLRNLTVGIAALPFASLAGAQLNGPAPLAWRFIQPSTAGPGGSPLVASERIYQSVGGRVFCIDKDTGNLRFRFPAIDPIPGVFRATPIMVGSTVVAVGDNRIAYGFDSENGTLKWSFNLTSNAYGQPVSTGKLAVIAQGDNKLVAINEEGEAAWANPFNVLDGILGNLGVYKNSVVFFNGKSELVSLDTTSLRYDWRRQLAQVTSNTTPVVFGESIFVNSGPYLVQLSAGGGLPQWQVPTGMQLVYSPAVSANAVAVVSQDGKVLAYDPTTRSAITKAPITVGSTPIAPITVSGDHVIVPTSNGGFALVDTKKSAIAWSYLIRPLAENENATSSSTPGGNNGRAGGPPGGLTGGARGGQGGNNANNNEERILTIQPAAGAVVAGQTLLVPARDGSLLAFDPQTGVDLTPPKVEMLFPNAGDQVSGQPPLLLVFKTEDFASGIQESTLKVTVGTTVLDYTLGRDGLLVIRFNQGGKNKPMSDGRKEIVVTVKDWMGNELKKSFALTIDNTLPPIQLPGTNQNNGMPGGGGDRGGMNNGRGGGGNGAGAGR